MVTLGLLREGYRRADREITISDPSVHPSEIIQGAHLGGIQRIRTRKFCFEIMAYDIGMMSASHQKSNALRAGAVHEKALPVG
ncbi:hypothetical protein [Burkholderia paludis]|uniref:hypothetical protein n=1 Tax=Burkholderia paludis TaxID=1506587 RepID=UPI0012699D6A|nr:hypothetical protein [Burkholderia paludis]